MTFGVTDGYFKSVDKFGGFEAVMSDESVDSDGEILDYLAFDPLPKHISIDVNHALTVEKTVASGVPRYEQRGRLLKVEGTFASTPLGQEVRTLVREGHIRGMSVVFRNAVRERDKTDGKVHIRKGVLVNCTITGIPSNTSTHFTSVKAGSLHMATTAEWAMARAKAQLALAQATLALTAPEPIGDHREFIRRNGSKAYVDAVLKGRR